MLSGDAIAQQLGAIVHHDTQAAAHRFDLTAGAVYRHTGIGQLDFGGSEFKEAPREEVAPEKDSPEDDYGWWILEDGTYFVRFNETPELAEGHVGLVCPHRRLLEAGGTHPAFCVDPDEETLETLLHLGVPGLRLKENSRIATMLVFAAK